MKHRLLRRLLLLLAALAASACASTKPPDTSPLSTLSLNGRYLTQDEVRTLLGSDQTRPLVINMMARQAGVSHEWDQFADGTGALTWRCRDVFSGEFGDNAWCANKPQIDSKWPGPYL